jgi:hypothetical protein
MVVHRVENEPAVKDLKKVTEQGLRPLVTNPTFGQMVKLILEARTQ